MTQEQFYNWMDDPSTMNADSIKELQVLTKRYPYFQVAQMMLAKNLKQENNIDQLDQLYLGALVAPDRRLFHAYMHDKRELLNQFVKVLPISSKKEENEEHAASPLTVVQHENVFSDELIPEPAVYQLETADLPELPLKEDVTEETIEPETLSFNDWLTYTQQGRLSKQGKEIQLKPERKPLPKGGLEIVDHFLSRNANEQSKKRAEFFNPQKVAAKSTENDFTVVSETLARIYFQQEKYGLARQSYEALSLKYPEKSIYFAARLSEIDEKLNSE